MYFEELTHDPVSLAFWAKTYKKFVIIFKKEQENEMHPYQTSLGLQRKRQYRKFVYVDALRGDVMKEVEEKKYLTSIVVQNIAS